MPLDSLIYETNDAAFKRRCVGWELQYSFLPRRCYYTGKYLWLRKAYMGTAIVTGPGEPVFEHRWCDKDSYLFLKIKGTI